MPKQQISPYFNLKYNLNLIFLDDQELLLQ